jgi:Flp pilus assembly protein CpaB
VPRKSVVAGAISTPDQLAQYVATQDVYEGEQVSTRRFAPPKEQGIRSQIKGTQRAYELSGDANQLLAGTLAEGDHVDVVGTWTIKNPKDEDAPVSRVILRNLLVMRAPMGTSSEKITSPTGSGAESVQLRLTDSQSQKLLWIQEHGDFYLTLRPPVNSLDSSNTFQDARLMLFDGPGRRP